MIPIHERSAALITKSEHLFYLTNFQGEGFVILTSKKTLLATDHRYLLLAKAVKKTNIELFTIAPGWKEKLQKKLQNIDRVSFEEDHLTISSLSDWKKILPGKLWNGLSGMITQLRLVKSDLELERLRTAAKLGDRILKKILPELKPGVSEKNISNLFRRYSDEMADGVSFPPIVAFGNHGAIPHHISGKRKLQQHDAILIDQGVNYRGYMSDMTRCFFIGHGIPAVREMYDLLFKVQISITEMVRAGVKISHLAHTTRTLLGKEAKYFTHSLGHGVGLEIHESPSVNERSNIILKKGMVITIEPGIYKAGIGGVRIEDTLIVTKNGCEIITKSSKNPFL